MTHHGRYDSSLCSTPRISLWGVLLLWCPHLLPFLLTSICTCTSSLCATEEGMLPFCLFPTLTMIVQRVRHVVHLTMVVQRVWHVVHLIWSSNEFGMLFMAGAGA